MYNVSSAKLWKETMALIAKNYLGVIIFVIQDQNIHHAGVIEESVVVITKDGKSGEVLLKYYVSVK